LKIKCLYSATDIHYQFNFPTWLKLPDSSLQTSGSLEDVPF